LANNLHNLGTV